MSLIKELFYSSYGVQTLVFNENGMVLLVLRADFPVWTLPGGRIEKGESAAEAAARELYEETGLLAEHFSSKGVFFITFLPLVGITELFLADGVSGTIRGSAETKKVQYFPVNELPWNLLPYLYNRIRQ